jgi:hypothetical protein
MKGQLLKVYKQRQNDFKNLIAKFPTKDMAGPFLMSPNEKYATQTNPLLIIGQETNGWEYFVNDLDRQMEAYENFNVGKKYFASPFWNVTRKVEGALGNELYTCAWTNISKFDLDCKRSYGEYATEISTLDDILLGEINILNPKICIFFTGPIFDKRIKNIFSSVQFESVLGFSPRQISQLKHPALPYLTFRSYHPNYLRRSKLESKFINFISSLAK